jgi:uracil-DNA glycosylase family 4
MRTVRERRGKLDILDRGIRRCLRCRLCDSRTQAVPGEGPLTASVMLVGEAPGTTEDVEGRPFIGRAGRFLDQMLGRAGLTRERVFVTNSVKCRPPRGRAPQDDELRICKAAWLDRQIALVNPRVIVLLGTAAIRQAFGGAPRLSDLHGQWRTQDGRTYLLTYHPASAMRFPVAGKATREDFRALKRTFSAR